MRIGLRQCLWLVGLASILCMAVRSFTLGDPIGMLFWPVLLGFGVDRTASGTGVLGGTLGGLVASGAAAVMLWAGGLACVLILAAGICWGFYLGVWIYIIVEIVRQAV